MPVIFRLSSVLSFYRIFLNIIKTFICFILKQFCESYISYSIKKQKKKKKKETVQTNIQKKKKNNVNSLYQLSKCSKEKNGYPTRKKKERDKEKTKIQKLSSRCMIECVSKKVQNSLIPLKWTYDVGIYISFTCRTMFFVQTFCSHAKWPSRIKVFTN